MTLIFTGGIKTTGQITADPVFTPGGETDPLIADVSCLMHFDNDLTTVSVGDTTATVQGGATLNSGNTKFGGGALDMAAGDNGVILTDVNNSLDFGTADFTWEGWFYSGAEDGGEQQIFSRSVGGFQIYYISDTEVRWHTTDVGGPFTVSFTSPVNLNAGVYRHLMFTRVSNNLRLAVDGVWAAESHTDNGNYNLSFLHVGFYSGFGANDFTTLIDDLRLTKAARETQGVNFTPPTAAFPNS